MNCLQFQCGIVALMTAVLVPFAPARAAEEPDLIFKRSTVFKWLTPNDKLATYGLDDPEVEGVACHFTVPEKGGFKGPLSVEIEFHGEPWPPLKDVNRAMKASYDKLSSLGLS